LLYLSCLHQSACRLCSRGFIDGGRLLGTPGPAEVRSLNAPEPDQRIYPVSNFCAGILAGIINSICFDTDLGHSTMIMHACMDGIALILGIYVSGRVADNFITRRADAADAKAASASQR
jgi:hypothetical protein